MARINTSGLKKRYGGLEVLKGIDVSIPDGSFTVIVGPSGCGKSTLLRTIAGLEEISSGDLFVDGERITDVDAADRGMAMVFQSYALYPHMTVRDNMSFALRMQKLAKDETDRRVSEAADLLKLTPYLDRKPRELSGGQRQRVAIGRAIVRQPKVFLFDEPLSNLDADLRAQMRVELADLHRRLGSTMVFVTHDQVEAMTLADQIVILRSGVVEQIGSPRQLYEDPDNLFVAGFMGSPRTNTIDAVVAQDGTLVIENSQPITALPGVPLAPGQKLVLTIRPELVDREDFGRGDVTVMGRVTAVEDLGGMVNVHADVAGKLFIAQRRSGQLPPIGADLSFNFRSADVRLFDQANGHRLRAHTGS